MKDKLDLSLDSRQIVSLLIAGVVVMGAVFVLGVVVGKKLSETDGQPHGSDVLAQLDEKAAAMQKVAEEPPLTFQETLTEKAPPPTKVEPKPEPKPEPKVAAAPAVKAEDPAPVAPAAVAAAPKGTIAPTPTPTRITPAPAPVAAPVAARAATNEPRPAMPSAPPSEGWTLQLQASQSRADADRFTASMREKGYAPYIVTAEVEGRGTWHRVRLGSFPSKEAATKYLADFKRETGMNAFIAPAH
jgi:cell division septation protein DedD